MTEIERITEIVYNTKDGDCRVEVPRYQAELIAKAIEQWLKKNSFDLDVDTDNYFSGSVDLAKAIDQYVTKEKIKLLKKMLKSQTWTYGHSVPLHKELARLEAKLKRIER